MYKGNAVSTIILCLCAVLDAVAILKRSQNCTHVTDNDYEVDINDTD